MKKLSPEEIRNLSQEEYEQYLKDYELDRTATIGYLIDYLKKNFKPDDRVCYMDCVEGVKNDCTYIEKEQLGDRFFRKLREGEASVYVSPDDVMMI